MLLWSVYTAVENLNSSPLIPGGIKLSLMGHCGFPILIPLSVLRSTDCTSTELHSGKKTSLSFHREQFSALLLIFIYCTFSC